MPKGQLHINDLRLRFSGQNRDLFHIPSLRLLHGASLGLRGASGTGKTTLLHCLAGIESPSSGQICWGETAISALSKTELVRWRQQKLGLIFQDFHLIEGLSALDNVLLPVRFTQWRATEAQRQRAHELLQRVGIVAQQRRAEFLSRGERQRVAVARALLFEPAVVLADEPTASLDPDNRQIIGDLLLDLVKQHGATLIVVSHEAELLAKLDSCLQLRQGTLQHTAELTHV